MLSNQRLHDIAVAKALYLERLKDGYRAQAERLLTAFLVAILTDLTTRIAEAGFAQMSPGTLRQFRRDFLAGELAHRAGFRRELESIFQSFAVEEVELQRELRSQDDGSVFVPIPPGELWRQAQQEILGEQGEQLGDFIGLAIAGISVAVVKALQSSYAAAESSQAVLARIRKVREQAKPRMGALVETAVQSVAATAFAMVWNDSPKYLWISILDSSTTDICRGRNGRVYTFGKGPRPPAHIRCRSTTSRYRVGMGPVRKETLTEWLKRNARSDLQGGPLTISKYKEKVLRYAQSQN